MAQRRGSSQRRNPCWSSSLPDRQDDGAMPLHHLTGRDQGDPSVAMGELREVPVQDAFHSPPVRVRLGVHFKPVDVDVIDERDDRIEDGFNVGDVGHDRADERVRTDLSLIHI